MELDSFAQDRRKKIGEGYGDRRSQPGEEGEAWMQPSKAVSREEPAKVEGDCTNPVQHDYQCRCRQKIAAVHGLRDSGDSGEEWSCGYLLRRCPEKKEEQGKGQVFLRLAAAHCSHRSHLL